MRKPYSRLDYLEGLANAAINDTHKQQDSHEVSKEVEYEQIERMRFLIVVVVMLAISALFFFDYINIIDKAKSNIHEIYAIMHMVVAALFFVGGIIMIGIRHILIRLDNPVEEKDKKL